MKPARFPFPLAALAACLVLSACGKLTTWQAEAPSAGYRDVSEEVTAIAAPLVNEGKTPGLMVGLRLPDGSTQFHGYGVTRHDNGAAPTPDTLFAVGSLSKGFLGAITNQLVQQGKIKWSDRLDDVMPPGTKLSPDSARITIEQLGTHTSGLPRQPVTLETLVHFVDYLFTGESFYQHFDRDEIFDYLADFKASGDQTPEYSNIGFALLGYCLERRTGQRIDDLLAELVTRPLGLRHTGYTPEVLPGFHDRAIGHAGDQPKFIRRGATVPDWRFTEIMRGSAAIYSSARDLLTFASAHLHQDGSPLSTALADTLRIRYDRPREAAALAWIVDDVGGTRITYQVGIVAGYTSYIGINPANRTAVVVLQNAFNWDYSVGHKLVLLLAG